MLTFLPLSYSPKLKVSEYRFKAKQLKQRSMTIGSVVRFQWQVQRSDNNQGTYMMIQGYDRGSVDCMELLVHWTHTLNICQWLCKHYY